MAAGGKNDRMMSGSEEVGVFPGEGQGSIVRQDAENVGHNLSDCWGYGNTHGFILYSNWQSSFH